MSTSHRIRIAALLLSTLALTGSATAEEIDEAPGDEERADEERGQVIRILSPPGRAVSGRTTIETLTISADVARVVFSVDGVEAAKKRLPPFTAKVQLASPPREQTVTVEALDQRGRRLGGDTIVVNRKNLPFRVRITAIEGDPPSTPVRVTADVSLPRNATLARLELYLNGKLRTINRSLPFAAELEIPAPADEDFVRVVAVLEDGRAAEDVELVSAPGLAEEIDVDLVQLQALVLRHSGAPVADLELEDFEIRERGEVQEIDRLYPAEDIALNLGLVLDSSGSMAPVWNLTMEAAEKFLTETMSARDRSFIVDFDTTLRLAQPLTDDLPALFASLEEIEPEGGTALFDSILYALLQFEHEPGRRALVVLTDGLDVHSTSKPRRSVEVARQLGVPVYIVALVAADRGPARPGNLMQSAPVHDLKLITDPTGGRLIRIRSAAGIGRAFAQINTELRHQYVLTYYSENPPDADELDAVEVRVPERKDVEVRAVSALDQVN